MPLNTGFVSFRLHKDNYKTFMNSSNTGFNEKEPPHKLLIDTIQNDMNLVEFQ